MWFGPPGAGKTTALLTYPSPITFINLDRAPGELTEQLPEHYEINYLRVHYDVDTTPAIANKVLNDIDGAARKAITASKSSGGGSFILDGYDLLWDYVKIAKLPKAGGDNLAREYGEANDWMHDLLARLYFCPLAVGFSALSKEIWRSQSKGTGTFDPEGFKHRGRWMTHEIYLYSPEEVSPSEKPLGGETGQTHKAYIKGSKHNEAQMVRKVIPNLTYKTLFKLTYGELPKGHELLWTPLSSPTATSPKK
jgi:hypothetical protein